METKTFEIRFSDLTNEAQKELTAFLGGEVPQEFIPIAILEVDSQE